MDPHFSAFFLVWSSFLVKKSLRRNRRTRSEERAWVKRLFYVTLHYFTSISSATGKDGKNARFCLAFQLGSACSFIYLTHLQPELTLRILQFPPFHGLEWWWSENGVECKNTIFIIIPFSYKQYFTSNFRKRESKGTKWKNGMGEFLSFYFYFSLIYVLIFTYFSNIIFECLAHLKRK